METYGYTQVSLYLLEGTDLVLQSQIGYEHVLERIPLTRGIMARAARSGQPVLVADVRSDADFLGAAEGTCSEVAIPLLGRDPCWAS